MAENGEFPVEARGDAADGETVSAVEAPDEAATKRRPGRPRGSRDKVTALGRDAITEAAPWDFLIRVMQGRVFKRAPEHNGRRTVTIRPTLDQSISAADALMRKVLADMKGVEMAGVDGSPISIETTETDPRETARRLAIILQLGDPDRADGAATPEAGRDGAPTPATASGFSDAMQDAVERARMRAGNGQSPVPSNGVDPHGAPTAADGEADTDQGEPEPPPPGHRLIFGRFGNETTITNVGPIRPGLADHVFELRRQHGGLVTSGAWAHVLASAAKVVNLAGDGWLDHHTEASAASPVAGVHESQLPRVAPLPAAGRDPYGMRKRWR